MEYIAKIIKEERSENKNFWKYTFIDIRTKKVDFFYNNYRISYNPNRLGKLKLLESSKHQLKFFQSFEQDIEEEEEKTLTHLEEDASQEIEVRDSKLIQRSITFEKQQLFETINNLHEEGVKWKTIASSFHRTDRALRYFRERVNRPLQKVGRKLAIDNDTLDFLFDWLQVKDTAITLKEMSDYLNGEFGKIFSESTIFRALKRRNITWKKSTLYYLEHIPLLGSISKYTEKVKLLPQSQIIALDECGFNLGEVSRYSWSFKGSRSFVLKPGQRGFNHTLILCIRNVEKQGVIDYKLIKNEMGEKKKKDKKEKDEETKKGTTAIDFYEFIKNINLPTSDKYYLLLDNARIHTATKTLEKLGLLTIKELILSKNIEPLYLVSYSPQLNPVEKIFNNVRHNIEKSRPRTFEELKSAVDKEIERLNKEDLTKYFKSCLNYFD